MSEITIDVSDTERVGKEIKCCPFCGRGGLRVASILGEWHVRCIKCRARGPSHEDKEQAIVAWNRRVVVLDERSGGFVPDRMSVV